MILLDFCRLLEKKKNKVIVQRASKLHYIYNTQWKSTSWFRDAFNAAETEIWIQDVFNVSLQDSGIKIFFVLFTHDL